MCFCAQMICGNFETKNPSLVSIYQIAKQLPVASSRGRGDFRYHKDGVEMYELIGRSAVIHEISEDGVDTR